jgi:uncharacterized membrane protein HdeD (DUF308 family)
MVNYSIFLGQSPEILDKIKKNAQIVGIIFVVLGLLGMFFPEILSLSSAIFFGWLLLFSGITIGWHLWQTNPKDWLGWLKFLLLSITGILVILNPLPGVITLGILFTSYFFIDSAASISLAFKLRPQPMWWISLLNGILSFALGVLFLMAIGNPLQALWGVGIFIGISLFFDGLVLLSLANTLEETPVEKKD